MSRRHLQTTSLRGRTPRASRPGHYVWPFLRLALTAALIVSAASSAKCAERAVVQRVEVTSTDGRLKITITTTASQPPAFETFCLRGPDRLVLQLPGFWLEAEGPRSISAGQAGVKRVRLAQFRSRPPIARLVFDLSVTPDRLRYQTISRPGVGSLEIDFSPPIGAPPIGAAPPAPITSGQVEPTPAPSPAVGPEPVPAPPEIAPAGAEPVAPAPSAPEMLEPLPAPGRRPSPVPTQAPRPAVPSAETPVFAWVLATVLGFLLAVLVARYVAEHLRARGRTAELRRALQSEEEAERLAALRALRQWPVPDLRSVRRHLLIAAADSSPPVAEEAADLVRLACPIETLVSDLTKGSTRARVEAAGALARHPAELAAAPLLEAAQSGPPSVCEAAVHALVSLVRQAPVRPILLALVREDQSAQEIAAEVIRAAGSQAARPLISALGDTDELVRCGAVEALLLVAPEGSGKALSDLLGDPLPQVRARAARALGLFPADAAYRMPLLAALQDPSPAVQQAAARSRARMGGEDIDVLLAALDRRASEQPDLPFVAVLLDTIASRCVDPLPALERAISGLNRNLTTGLSQALERAGRLDAWVQGLPQVETEQRELRLSLLRAAGERGVTGPLLRGLEAPDPALQELCARLLAEVREQEAVQGLSHLLSLPHESLRTAGAQALSEIGGPEAVSALISALADPASLVRATAAQGLARAVGPAKPTEEPSTDQDTARSSAAAALAKALQDPHPDVRAAAAAGIAVLHVAEHVPALVELALRDAESAVRTAAVAALGQMRAYDVLPLLMDVVNDADPELRGRAVHIFASAGDPMVADVLVGALRDEDVNVRKSAGRGLWEIATQGHTQTLIPYLNSPDPRVRCAIAGAIGKTEAAEHAAVLAEAITDPDAFVRASVVNAFRSLGEAAADYVSTLVGRLADSDAYVRARAVEAISTVVPTSEEAAHQVIPLAADPDPRVREAVAVYLLALLDREVQGPILELLGDPARRPEALQLLHEADEAQLRKLLHAARSAPEETRRTAMETISYLLSRRWTAQDFRAELDSLDPEVRLGGLEGLALVGSAEAVREVIRVLNTDPSHEIRVRAARILGQSSDAAAWEALKKVAAEDPDPRVRDAALLLTQPE